MKHKLTTTFDLEAYKLLKTYSFQNNISINDFLWKATVYYLNNHLTEEEFSTLKKDSGCIDVTRRA